MAKKYPKSEAIQDASFVGEQAYVAWGEDLASKKEALKTSSESLSEFTGVQKTSGGMTARFRDYSGLTTNSDGRPGLSRSDYDYFRPGEAVPVKQKDIIARAEEIYQRVGLVKNIIDLMGDFAVQGIRLSHRNKRIERFYRKWFKKISGKDRSERFLNNLYKTGNVIINKQTAKINLKVTESLYKSLGSPDLQIIDIDDVKIGKKEIPWRYTFIDPLVVEVASGPLAAFVQKKQYQLILPAGLRKLINSPKTDADRSIINSLPAQIIEAAKNKKPYPLEPDKTLVFHYKKDDWQAWAYPMIYAIMDDINVIEKLKLADMAALDGAISNIRIFKLGSLEHKIAPTKAATAKLAQILGNNVGGGTMDLVWGPDIELLESNTNVHNFLGEGKYVPHLNSIYAGLGIPPTLTGTFGASGTTNNFISLKTLTQRLQYGRDILVQFWENEIALVQKAMDDRNLISDELLQTRFGFDPEMEKTRLNREIRERHSDRMAPKAGPWHDPQFENSLKKIALQSGSVAPSQVGLELEKKKSGEKAALEMKTSQNTTKLVKDSSESLPKEAGEGRPKLSKDSKQRKQKKFTPQTGASLLIWASQAQEKISEVINPILLEFYSKKNLRTLSKQEIEESENTRTKVLFSFQPFSQITEDKIVSAFSNINNPEFSTVMSTYNNWLNNLKHQLHKELSVDETKQAKASFYCSVYSN